MASNGCKALLLILNSIYVILSLLLCVVSVWFFMQVQEITSLRNSNHVMLDFNVYWPQAIPWMFFVAGVFVIIVSCCGFAGVKRSSKGLMCFYIVFLSISVIFMIAMAVTSLCVTDTEETNEFVKTTILDVYRDALVRENVQIAYGNIERKYHCCGANSPTDYSTWKQDVLPMSCCAEPGWFADKTVGDCKPTDYRASEKHGCVTVVSKYAKIVIRIISGSTIFLAFVGACTLVVAIYLLVSLKQKKRLSSTDEACSKEFLYK